MDFFYFNDDPFDMAIILEPGESVYMIAFVNWPEDRFDDYLNNGKDRHIAIDYSSVYNWEQAQ